MDVPELRRILNQMGYWYLRDRLLRRQMSEAQLQEALLNTELIYRERLEAFVGKERKDWANLQLPKWPKGYMKPGYANACYGLRTGLRHLNAALSRVPSEFILEEENQVCPHCGEKLTIKVRIEKRSSV